MRPLGLSGNSGGMINRATAPLILLCCLIVTAGCGSVTPSLDGHQPDPANAKKAAEVAFGSESVCEHTDPYRFTCVEADPTCGVDVPGEMNWDVHDAGCYLTTCDVTLDTPQRRWGTGKVDFYFCERTVIGCQSLTGGCPADDVCVTGRGKYLERNIARTEYHRERVTFDCPFFSESN